MAESGPIALFDSGEGGLTVLRHLVTRFPEQTFIYAADSAHFPYGEKSLKDVRRWFLTVLDFFQSHGARAVVIACNTATAAALPEAQARAAIPVIGVIAPAAERAAELTRNRRIGVLSTEATHRSGLYVRELHTVDATLTVLSQPCPILVTMAENGHIDGKNVEHEVRQCLAPVLNAGVDTLILGCTHFPHMRHVFNRVVAGRAAIVDPGEEIAANLETLLPPAQSSSDGVCLVNAWTTGPVAPFAAVARRLCPDIPMTAHPLIWDGDRLIEPADIP